MVHVITILESKTGERNLTVNQVLLLVLEYFLQIIMNVINQNVYQE